MAEDAAVAGIGSWRTPTAQPHIADIHLMKHAAWLLSPGAALALALVPVSVSGQASTSARDEVVWHWFADCAGGDSLVLDVTLDGKPIYSSAFPICRLHRGAIKPEPQQRLLQLRFNGVPRRFGARHPSTDTVSIQGNIWEAGGERHAILLGVSFATEDKVLLNTVHLAQANAASRSERVRGLVITTRPVRRGDGMPRNKGVKTPVAPKPISPAGESMSTNALRT
ncbi:MAG: hypothetical protein DMD28_08760 [Gemmatimonadetes bacterium]|nr:MAG: hypothetical protein DMD28_08760 [Gemmatimonadota bacterium]